MYERVDAHTWLHREKLKTYFLIMFEVFSTIFFTANMPIDNNIFQLVKMLCYESEYGLKATAS